MIGAQRSGSSYLYQLLDEHPEVSMAHPLRPEPKFFMNFDEIAKGKKYYEEIFFSKYKPTSVYFGEKSTSYIESRDAAKRISNFYPEAKILIILRNPARRAYSNYLFSVENGIENLSFRDALDLEKKRLKQHFATSVCPYSYQTRGVYINYIEMYLQFFNADQIKVILLEELVADLTVIQSVYDWLGIDGKFTPMSINKVINQSESKFYNLDPNVLLDLSLCYEESNAKLENFLGRKINCWK